MISRARKAASWASYRWKCVNATSAHAKALRKVRRSGQARVAFLPIHAATWKHDRIIERMLEDGRFEPLIVICPDTTRGRAHQQRELERCRDFFSGRSRAKVFNMSDAESFIDIRRSLCPDLIFHQNPWELTLPQYSISSLFEIPGCYFPYTWGVEHEVDWIVNKPFHNLLWRFFLPSRWHLELATRLSVKRGSNAEVVGYPGIDPLWSVDSRSRPTSLASKKSVIWAPHHSIAGEGAGLDWSTFLRFSEFMIELANEYSAEIDFYFKPHPLLRPKLEQPGYWGARRTALYWDRWRSAGRQSAEASYHELFLRADAMIHDCGSFLAEWLAVGKPGMYLLRDERLTERLNEVGGTLLGGYYPGRDEEDIRTFLNSVVLGGADPLTATRAKLSKEYLRPPTGSSAADAVFESLARSVFGPQSR